MGKFWFADSLAAVKKFWDEVLLRVIMSMVTVTIRIP